MVAEGRLAHKRWTQGRRKRTWRECWAVGFSIAGLKDRFVKKTGLTMGIVMRLDKNFSDRGIVAVEARAGR